MSTVTWNWASIDAIPDSLYSTIEGLSPSTLEVRVAKAYLNARSYLTDIEKFDIDKAFKLYQNRDVISELSFGRGAQSYPFLKVNDLHDLHCGRAAFIGEFIRSYTKSAITAGNDNIYTSKKDIIDHAKLGGFETILDIMGVAYGIGAITADSLLSAASLIGEIFGYNNDEDAIVGPIALFLMGTVGRSGGFFVNAVVVNALDELENKKALSEGNDNGRKYAILMYGDTRKALLQKVWSWSVARSVRVESEEKFFLLKWKDLLSDEARSLLGFYLKQTFKLFANGWTDFEEVLVKALEKR